MNEIVIRIEGLEELTKAVQALVDSSCTHVQSPVPAVAASEQMPGPVTQAPQAAPVSVMPQPVTPQVPVMQPPVTSVVPGTSSVTPLPAPVPTTAAPQQYSFDQLAVAMSNLCVNVGKQPEVHALLNQFGVNALFDLPKDRYGEFATALRGIGGVI